MAVQTIFVVHHSHTDIGYTDLQENVIYRQMDYIRHAVRLVLDARKEQSPDQNFRWNCETYFCVERYLAEATEQEKKDFEEAVRLGGIGLSANYLNFNDLSDAEILFDRTKEMVEKFAAAGIPVKTAMNADINGISLGARDALIDNGIEFLYTNIHTHHGMYPLFHNQTPYFWENESGKRLLVWNGEHYNLGNALGLTVQPRANFMTQNYFGAAEPAPDDLTILKNNLFQLIKDYEASGYPYDFIITSVSGVFSDNAPPNVDIARRIRRFNALGLPVQIKMVTLSELYEAIRDKVQAAPVYRGDLTDWWAHGVGSTPYAVKHYREAQKMYHLCRNLGGREAYPALMRRAEDQLLLYAEHTWGHSSTISNPYDTMVQNLDFRKNSYASGAHEAAAMALQRLKHRMGDTLRYYDLSGEMTAMNPTALPQQMPVEFFIEAYLGTPDQYPAMEVKNKATGQIFTPQLSPDPRGVMLTFIDSFGPMEQKKYSYQIVPSAPKRLDSTKAYIGAERVRDLVNPYDTKTYKLPHRLENNFFCIRYQVGKGVTSFYHKGLGLEMLKEGIDQFFTPLYECTSVSGNLYDGRRVLGRNIRGINARLFQGELTDIQVAEQGDVFQKVELIFALPGTVHCSVILKMYEALPRIDFTLKLGKTLSSDIESVFMPLTLHFPGTERYLDKGGVIMRPGIDQLPGAGMEYFMTDTGLLYTGKQGSLSILTGDVPLIYQGEMAHHEIVLCDRKPENNQRPLYSWIMNNIWETNFKLGLSGFDEFRYTLMLSPETDPRKAAQALSAQRLGGLTFISG